MYYFFTHVPFAIQKHGKIVRALHETTSKQDFFNSTCNPSSWGYPTLTVPPRSPDKKFTMEPGGARVLLEKIVPLLAYFETFLYLSGGTSYLPRLSLMRLENWGERHIVEAADLPRLTLIETTKYLNKTIQMDTHVDVPWCSNISCCYFFSNYLKHCLKLLHFHQFTSGQCPWMFQHFRSTIW